VADFTLASCSISVVRCLHRAYRCCCVIRHCTNVFVFVFLVSGVNCWFERSNFIRFWRVSQWRWTFYSSQSQQYHIIYMCTVLTFYALRPFQRNCFYSRFRRTVRCSTGPWVKQEASCSLACTRAMQNIYYPWPARHFALPHLRSPPNFMVFLVH